MQKQISRQLSFVLNKIIMIIDRQIDNDDKDDDDVLYNYVEIYVKTQVEP